MEIKIGFAKRAKLGNDLSADSYDVAERLKGGISFILTSGQGDPRTAHTVSAMAAKKAAELLAEGERDEKISEKVHAYLYEQHGKRTVCTLTIISVDTAEEKIIISRNAAAPVLVRTKDYETTYDEAANPIGLQKHSKPEMYELPIAGNIMLAFFGEGIKNLGRKTGRTLENEKIFELMQKNDFADTAFIAENILDYFVFLEKNEPNTDMAAAVLSVVTEGEDKPPVGKIFGSYVY